MYEGTTDNPATQYLQAARAALRTNQSWIAMTRLRELLAIEPQNAEAYELLGIAAMVTKDLTTARTAFLKATEYGPRRASAHYNYALFLDRVGELDEAIEHVQTALFLSPSHVGAQGLQKKLSQTARDRANHSDVSSQTSGIGAAPVYSPSGRLMSLECPYCHGMNHVTARVCGRCNMRLPDQKPVVPVE